MGEELSPDARLREQLKCRYVFPSAISFLGAVNFEGGEASWPHTDRFARTLIELLGSSILKQQY